MMMMMLLQLHAVNDDVIDDEKNFSMIYRYASQCSRCCDVVALSLSPDDVVEYPSCCVEIL
jgi:hypothetical protein